MTGAGQDRSAGQRERDEIDTLLVAADTAAIRLDPSLCLRFFTPPAAALLELDESAIGRPLGDFMPDFDHGQLLSDVQDALREPISVAREVPAGEDRHLLIRALSFPVRDDRVDGVVVTFVDISSRVRAERALRDSERQLRQLNRQLERLVSERTRDLEKRESELRSLVDNVPSLYCYVDAAEVHRFVNINYREYFGLEPDRIIGMPTRELLGDDAYALIKPRLDAALGGEPQRFVETLPLPTAAYRFDITFTPDRDAGGGVNGVYVLVHDLTEVAVLTSQLRDRERRLEAIFRTAPHGIMVIDRQGMISEFSPAAERIFQYSRAEVLERPATMLLPAGCSGCGEFPACFSVSGCPFSSGRSDDLIGCRRDGGQFPLGMEVAKIDHLEQWVVVLRDNSERRELQKQVIEASSLEQERIGREIHDGIGQQLTGISLLMRNLQENLAAAGQEDGSTELGKLIDHMTVAQKAVRALAHGLAPVAFEPEGLPSALSALARETNEVRGVECRFIGPLTVDLDSQTVALQLYRIAQEAVNNALRHAAPRHIEIRLRLNERRELTVTDDGCGFDYPPTTGGHGLQIMRYRAELLGGELTIRTSPGAGTTVFCSLPAGPLRRG